VELGENCLVAGQTGIGGKTKIGNRVKIYGQAGIANNISVGDDTVILARSGVLKSLAGGKTYFGLPAEEARQKFMEIIAVRNLVRKSSTQNE
jgi:UDP-3-O-[3-hydroxymyristoyl] glucosamine N-acyltransferase